MSGSLAWYAHRLARMSPAEVTVRCLDAGRHLTWRRRQVRPGDQPPPIPPGDRRFTARLPVDLAARVPPRVADGVLRAADDILAGRWTILGVNRDDIADPDWFLDPVTEQRAPADQFATTINHRDHRVTGNVKQIWELSRHHHLTVMAAAYWLTEDETYATPVAAQLNSWWKANPNLSGINWTSGIELGVRLVAWTWIRRLLDTWPQVTSLFEQNPWAVAQIRWHQEFLAAFRSTGSSANNHLVAEQAGRLAAACAFDWFPQSRAWRLDSSRRLGAALQANTFPGGLNREQASEYHRFVAELGLLAGAEADYSDTPLTEQAWAVLGHSIDAAAAVVDQTGRPPRQGDGDDGRALVVDPADTNPWSHLLSAGATVFGGMPWWPQTRCALFPILIGAIADQHPVSARLRRRPNAFEAAGTAILRSQPGSGPQLWVRCDGGPHGFGTMAAHAHADALAIELRVDGVDILADPGTYCYHGEPLWRDHFRSTIGHNTVEIDGVDQSVAGGPFLWTTAARASMTLLETERGLTWRGRHDGYHRLPDPVSHTRDVVMLQGRDEVTVTDTMLGGTGRHQVKMAWHLGPAVTAHLDGHTAHLDWGEATARFMLPQELDWEVVPARAESPLGWYSPSFGVRVGSTTLVGVGSLQGQLVLNSTLTVLSADATLAPQRIGLPRPRSRTPVEVEARHG